MEENKKQFNWKTFIIILMAALLAFSLYKVATLSDEIIIVGIIVGIVSLVAIFGGALMKLFGFTYEYVGRIILFFVI